MKYFIGERTAYLSNGFTEKQISDREVVSTVKELLKRKMDIRFFLEMGHVFDLGLAQLKSTATNEVEIHINGEVYLAKPSLYGEVCACVREFLRQPLDINRILKIVNAIKAEKIILEMFVDLENQGLIRILESNDIVVFGRLHAYLIEFKSGITYLYDCEEKGRQLCIVSRQPFYNSDEKTQIFLAKALFLINDLENRKRDAVFARQI